MKGSINCTPHLFIVFKVWKTFFIYFFFFCRNFAYDLKTLNLKRNIFLVKTEDTYRVWTIFPEEFIDSNIILVKLGACVIPSHNSLTS